MKAALVNGKGETPIYGDFMDPQGDEQHIVVNVKAAAISQLAKSRAAEHTTVQQWNIRLYPELMAQVI